MMLRAGVLGARRIVHGRVGGGDVDIVAEHATDEHDLAHEGRAVGLGRQVVAHLRPAVGSGSLAGMSSTSAFSGSTGLPVGFGFDLACSVFRSSALVVGVLVEVAMVVLPLLFGVNQTPLY